MFRQNRLLTGYISKPHGTGGKVAVRLIGDFAERFKEREPLFIEINETLVPFFIQEVERFNDKVILKLDFLDSVENAGQFAGCKVYLDIPSEIIKDIGTSSFIGYKVKDQISGMNGVIADETDTPMNPLFVVRNKETEFYIPFHPDLIVSINHKNKCIIMRLPDGFDSI